MRTNFVFLLIISITLSLEAFAQKQVRVIPLPDKTGFTVESSTKDLGNGFFDHGVASPISNHRGVVSTVDGNGRNVVLVWLFDHRGGYSLLMIDAETGKSEEFTIPFNPKQDTPYSSILSSSNKFYTHFSDHFTEFDPVKRAFTFTQKTMPQMAMAMTEDDNGKIWAITYPNSGMISLALYTRKTGVSISVHWLPMTLAGSILDWVMLPARFWLLILTPELPGLCFPKMNENWELLLCIAT